MLVYYALWMYASDRLLPGHPALAKPMLGSGLIRRVASVNDATTKLCRNVFLLLKVADCSVSSVTQAFPQVEPGPSD